MDQTRTQSTQEANGVQLPPANNEDAVQAAGDCAVPLEGTSKKYHVGQTQDSKLRLQKSLMLQSFKMMLRKDSIDQLQLLVHVCSADPHTLSDEVQQKAKDCEGKLWQLLDIENQLRALQLSDDQTKLLLRIYSTWLQVMLPDRIDANTLQTVAFRLCLMHETNDSVWLLCDGLDWLLREVQIILLLQQTGEDKTNQCPADEQEELDLPCRFTRRLKDWWESLDKQQRLYKKLSVMFQCWPQYPWQDVNRSQENMSIRRTKSTGHLDIVIHHQNIDFSPSRQHCAFKPIMKCAKSQDQLCQMAPWDVILEAVFPSCAMYLLPNVTARENAAILSTHKSGEVYQMVRGGNLIAGSQAEGLTMGEGWGHPWPDMDMMDLYGDELGVTIPGQQPPSSHHRLASTPHISCLEYAPEGCPPAYTRLRVTNLQTLLKHRYGLADCVVEEDGIYWLNTHRLNEKIQMQLNKTRPGVVARTTGIIGPAGQTSAEGTPVDLVPTLVANGPHPAMKDYLKRPRGEWPPPEQLCEVQQLPMSLVLVGSKESHNPNQQARNSWSTGEMLLMSKLPRVIKKGLIAAKCTLKYFVKLYRDGKVTDDGRSYVGSYHLKTTLFNYLEKTSPSKFDSAFPVMMTLFQELRAYLKRGNLPHYFLPECNLLATVGCNERQIALQAIQDIVSDPAAALLKCPSEPLEIYGDICPDALVAAFHRVSVYRCGGRSREDLVQLLCQLDQTRERRYQRLVRTDELVKVSSRPELAGLVEMLEAWNKSDT